MFAWNDSLSVGNAPIDAQHKQLISMISNLHDAMKKGQSKAILGKILDELVDYTIKHFAAEETLMRMKSYAELPQHHLIHDQFTARITKLRTDYKAGDALVNIELMDFLQKWLLTHIQGTDVKYARDLQLRA